MAVGPLWGLLRGVVVSKIRWTLEEIALLKEQYNNISNNILANKLGRSLSAVREKASSLGLKLSEEEKQRRIIEGRILAGIDTRGKNNPNWKGGIAKNNYHYKKIQVERYPDRCKARKKVHNALRSGTLIKQGCLICGEERVFAHHEDYSKPLEVIWLCRKHHTEYHMGLIELSLPS